MASIFQHGVASGDPLQDGVILWTRLTVPTAEDVQLSWAVSTDADFDDVVSSGTGLACADDDHTVRIDVTGLRPGHRYFYRFHALGQISSVGRTRTLPANDADHMRFAQVCGAKFNAGFFNAYGRIAARANQDELDFVLHLGGYIYESADVPPEGQSGGADIGRPFDPRHECKTLADYRTRYSQYRRDPDLQRMHAALPIIATLGDHELADGAWRGGAHVHEEARDGTWGERVKTALRARREWLPIRVPDPADPLRVYRSLHFGRLADLYVLDATTSRDEPAPAPRLHDPDRSILGVAQRKWLFGEFSESDTAWRIIASPRVLGTTWKADLPEPARAALQKMKLIAEKGPGPNLEDWDGYPAERYLLVRKIRDHKLGNFVVLSGDIQMCVAQELKVEPASPSSRAAAVECGSTSITAQNFDDKMKWPARTQSIQVEQALLQQFPQIKYMDLDSHGYSIVDVTAERMMVEWWNVETVLRRSDKEWRGAAFQIPSGTPALIPVAR